MTKTFEQSVSAKVRTLTTVASVVKLAGSINTRAANLDIDMHAAGIGALRCALQFRNTEAAAVVASSLGLHTRSKAFATWIEAHSNVRLTLDKKKGAWLGKMAEADDRHDDATLETLLDKAIAAPFWSVEEKSATDFSLHAALRALLKKAETGKAKGVLSEADKLAMVELTALTEALAPKPAQSSADALESVG